MALDYVAAINAITAEFHTLWGGASPRTPVQWPNTGEAPPAKTHGATAPAAWVRPTIVNGEAWQADAGATAKKWRRPGTLIVQVFTQEGRGDGTGNVLAQVVVDHFQALNLDGIQFQAGTIRLAGSRDGWFQVNASVPFWFDTHS